MNVEGQTRVEVSRTPDSRTKEQSGANPAIELAPVPGTSFDTPPPTHPTAQTIRRRSLHAMQRQQGNQAVQRMLQRLPVSGQTLQRDPVLLGPVVTHSDPRRERELQQLADQAMARLPGVGRSFLNEWYSASNGALAAAAEPSVPESLPYWWIALAGNLAWAATSLFPGAQAAVVAVSFAGAAVGSGAVQRATETPAPPVSGRETVGRALAVARDRAESTIRPAVIDAATDIATNNISDPEQQDRVLWGKICPAVPFEGRFQQMYDSHLARINGALRDFIAQYMTWRSQIDVIVDLRVREEVRAASGPIGEPGERSFRASMTVVRSGLIRPEVEAANPFTPRISF